jgi:hypothetical protein
MDLSQLPPETLAALMPLIEKMKKIRTAHGIITSLSVLIWFPLGVFLLRLLKVKKTVWWHAIWQGIGLCLMIAGFGMGRWLSGKAKVSRTYFSTFFDLCMVLNIVVVSDIGTIG